MPLIFHYASRDTELAPNTPRAKQIPSGTYVVLGMLSAMHDSEFRTDREVEYLHFGHGVAPDRL